jgi:hypothetical protein
VREADNLPPYSADVKKSRSRNSPRPLWACMACNGCALPLPLYNYLQPESCLTEAGTRSCARGFSNKKLCLSAVSLSGEGGGPSATGTPY